MGQHNLEISGVQVHNYITVATDVQVRPYLPAQTVQDTLACTSIKLPTMISQGEPGLRCTQILANVLLFTSYCLLWLP